MKPVRGVAMAWTVLAVAACGDGSTEPDTGIPFDLPSLFRPATGAEIAVVEADWDRRSPEAEDVRVERTIEVEVAGVAMTLTVVSHRVDGFRHYGAILEPDAAPGESLPVLVYAHPGENGVNVDEVLTFGAVLDEVGRRVVWLVPSFRSERLVAGGDVFVSEGPPSPWDRDVDDTMALIDVALERVAAADPERIGALGLSRGAGVALLLGIRDPRIDAVVEFFGPTDFLHPWVRRLVEETVEGVALPPVGAELITDGIVDPLVQGTATVDEVRLELVRRSAVLFAHRLPDVQIHHGTLDGLVPSSQAESLIAALEAEGRGEPADEWFLYPGGGHNPLSLPGSISATVTFLERLLVPAAATADARAPGRRP